MQTVSRVNMHSVCSVSYYGNDICRLVVQAMRQMLVEGDKMRNVDVAVVLFREHILSYLVTVVKSENLFTWPFAAVLPVDVDVLKVEFEDEVDQLFLDLLIALASDILTFTKQAERVYRLPIHCALSVLAWSWRT